VEPHDLVQRSLGQPAQRRAFRPGFAVPNHRMPRKTGSPPQAFFVSSQGVWSVLNTLLRAVSADRSSGRLGVGRPSRQVAHLAVHPGDLVGKNVVAVGLVEQLVPGAWIDLQGHIEEARDCAPRGR
jgi:hypothetical protein